jgi:hypothetical protein
MCCSARSLCSFTIFHNGSSTFPLVFAIQSAFGRRERALSTIAQFKASAVGLYYMHRDWTQVCVCVSQTRKRDGCVCVIVW